MFLLGSALGQPVLWLLVLVSLIKGRGPVPENLHNTASALRAQRNLIPPTSVQATWSGHPEGGFVLVPLSQ